MTPTRTPTAGVPAVSLFSGYAGLDAGVTAELARRGIHVDLARVCDIEPAAAALLAHHYPHVPNLGDITAIDWAQVRAELVDEFGEDAVRALVMTGGFPCTDVSAAGRRAGLTPDTRSGLWAHMRHAIAVLRPALVVIENVRGLTSARAASDVEPCPWCLGDRGGDDQDPALRALGAVLGDLAALGFDAEWIGCHASDVGAPHGRCRVFVAAWPAGAAAGDAGCGGVQRRAERRSLAGTEDPRAGEGLQRERRGDTAGDAGAAAQDPDGAAGRERGPAGPGEAQGGRARPDARGRSVNAAPDAPHDGLDRPGSAWAGRAGSAHGGRDGVAPDADRDGRAGRGSGDPGEADARGGRSRSEAAGRRPDTAPDPASDGRDEGRPEPARILGRPDAAVGGAAPGRWGQWPDEPRRAAAAPDADGGRLRPHLVDDAAREPHPAGGAAPDPDGPRRHPWGRLHRLAGPTAVGDRAPAPPHPDRDGQRIEREGPGREAWDDADGRGEGRPDGLEWGAYAPAIHRWAAILGRDATPPTTTGQRGGQQLAARFVEWMMGLHAGWVCDVPGLTRPQQLKLLGNGVVPMQAAAATRALFDRAPEALGPLQDALAGRWAA